MAEEKNCSDCGDILRRVKILDATGPGFKGDGIHHRELSYAAMKSQPSLFLGAVSKEGTVVAMICEGCGRIFLYGMPKG